MNLCRLMFLESKQRLNSFKKYTNGNYTVYISTENGTKMRVTDDEKFVADFPKSIDIKITNRYDLGCPFCHEDSIVNGKHADIDQVFLDSLRPFQEIAIRDGNVLSHPELERFLNRLKDKQVVPSVTLN